MPRDNRQLSDEVDLRCSLRRILVVDQDIRDLSDHTAIFDAPSFEVYKCSSYETALRFAEKEDFDLAIVDQGGSDFEGQRVLRHLNRYDPWTPIIVLAKYSDIKSQMQAAELGAIEYLQKPVSREELLRVVEKYLGTPRRQ